MNVKKSTSSNVVILSVSGRVNSSNAREFEKAVIPEVDSASDGIILDGSSLEYISSAGLRVILMAAKAAQKSDINFAVTSLNSEISDVFLITGFDSVIDLEPNIEAALNKFNVI